MQIGSTLKLQFRIPGAISDGPPLFTSYFGILRNAPEIPQLKQTLWLDFDKIFPGGEELSGTLHHPGIPSVCDPRIILFISI